MANQIFTDGCTMTATPGNKYSVAGGSYTAGKGRFGTTALAVTNAAPGVSFPLNPQTVVVGIAVQISTLPGSGATGIVRFFDSNAGGAQCYLGWNSDGTLQFFLGSSTTPLGAKSVSTFPANSIIQLEIKAKIDPTVGTLECRLNGNTTPILTFSGNTRNTANSYVNRIDFALPLNTTAWFSDIYMFDTSGSAPNDFLGNKRVYTLMPNADSATAGLNQFSTQPSKSAGSHYQNVNETPPDGDTSYNYSGTSGQRESYKTAGLPANVNGVSLVNIWSYNRIDDANPISVKIGVRSNSVDSFSGAINSAASFTYYSQPFPLDPATGVAWLPDGANTGVKNAELALLIV